MVGCLAHRGHYIGFPARRESRGGAVNMLFASPGEAIGRPGPTRRTAAPRAQSRIDPGLTRMWRRG